jgi:hypothetical protein
MPLKSTGGSLKKYQHIDSCNFFPPRTIKEEKSNQIKEGISNTVFGKYNLVKGNPETENNKNKIKPRNCNFLMIDKILIL